MGDDFLNQNNNHLNDILKNSKVDKKEIENAVKTGKTDKLINNLSPEDKQKLLNVMNDKEAMNNILKSPKAQAILKLFGGKNG